MPLMLVTSRCRAELRKVPAPHLCAAELSSDERCDSGEAPRLHGRQPPCGGRGRWRGFLPGRQVWGSALELFSQPC